jgi:hypothetical protein
MIAVMSFLTLVRVFSSLVGFSAVWIMTTGFLTARSRSRLHGAPEKWTCATRERTHERQSGVCHFSPLDVIDGRRSLFYAEPVMAEA